MDDQPVGEPAPEPRDRPRAESEMANAVLWFRSVVAHAPDLLAVLDPSGVVTYISPSVEPLLGYSPKELVGQRFAPLSDVDAVALNHTLGEQPGAPIFMEGGLRHRDGRLRAFEGSVTNLLDDPAVNGYVVNGRDVTDRRDARGCAAAQRDGTARDRAGVTGRDPRARSLVPRARVEPRVRRHVRLERGGGRRWCGAVRPRGARSRTARRARVQRGDDHRLRSASLASRRCRHRREPRDCAARRQHGPRSDGRRDRGRRDRTEGRPTRRRRERGSLPFARAAPHRHDPRARARRHDRVRQPERVGIYRYRCRGHDRPEADDGLGSGGGLRRARRDVPAVAGPPRRSRDDDRPIPPRRRRVPVGRDDRGQPARRPGGARDRHQLARHHRSRRCGRGDPRE